MAGQLEESPPQSEHTDELPVLSEEAILEFERAGPGNGTAAADRLDESVEALRAALQRAERRWLKLETRLESQDRAITELREALGELEPDSRPPPPPPAVPELTEIVLMHASAPAIEADDAPAANDVPAGSGTEQVLLERIAGLEAYITGRADRWREMEAEVEAKVLRIAELESELEQRIARERNLEQRLHDEGDRTDGLRDRLRRLDLRLQELGGRDVSS